MAPSASSRRCRLLGDGQVHVLLERAGGPTAPGLLAAVARVEHDVRPAMGVPRTVASPPHGVRATKVPSSVRPEHGQHHARRRDHRGRASASAPRAGATVVVVLGGAWSWWRRWSWWALGRRRALVGGLRSARARHDRQQCHHDQAAATRTQAGRHRGHDAMRATRAGRAAGSELLDDLDHEGAGLGGVLADLRAGASSASILAAAVPLPPETMAPAWPIFLPGGAVTPAM